MELIERARQRDVLTWALEQSARGNGSLVVVQGTLGSGRTAMLQGFAAQVREHGGTFLGGAAFLSERNLPLGVVRQLFTGADAARLDPGRLDRARMSLLLEAGGRAAAAQDSESPVLDLPLAEIMEAFWAAALELTAHGPLVIGVDDFEHIDVLSLHCLLYFARRLGSARLAIVLNDTVPARSPHRLLRGELLRLPHCRTVQLDPLTAEAVAALLAAQLDERTARARAGEGHFLTAGIPALVQALAADTRQAAGAPSEPGGPGGPGGPDVPSAPGTLVTGENFQDTAVGLVRRSAPVVRSVAHGLAVLDRLAGVRRLSAVLGVDVVTAAEAVQTLEAMGLLADERFRAPAARSAVLADMSPEDRAALYHRSAEVLSGDGACALVIAEQLLLEVESGEPWMLPILEDAAETALGQGDLGLAGKCLKLAVRSCADHARRAVLLSKLALMEWGLDPASASGYFPVLIEAQRRGHLSGRYTAALLRSLLWNGRFDIVSELLKAKLDAEENNPDGRQTTLLKLSHTYPALLDGLGREPGELHGDVPAEGEAAALLVQVLTEGGDEDTAARAERILGATVLADTTMDDVQSALLALVYSNRIDSARAWCERVLAEDAGNLPPIWRAVVSVIQAETALRLGDLPALQAHAEAAFQEVSPRSWGVAVGAPLASRLYALTERGRLTEAAELLRRRPVPKATFQTRCGLHLLHARGHYHLAIGQPRAALGDFLACGDFMTGWGLDLPGLVPWRSDAATAYLRLGDHAEAQRLAEEQLGCVGVEGTRAHGLALHVLAATRGVADRPAILEHAADVLLLCGDRLEQAKVLAALAEAQQAMGEDDSARAAANWAWRLAESVDAEPLLRRLAPYRREENTADLVAQAEQTSKLSVAELRVASLAAEGVPNKEIAARVYITVSTVEQHLTSVYRKLGVRRRTELRDHLPKAHGAGPDSARTDGAPADEEGSGAPCRGRPHGTSHQGRPAAVGFALSRNGAGPVTVSGLVVPVKRR